MNFNSAFWNIHMEIIITLLACKNNKFHLKILFWCYIYHHKYNWLIKIGLRTVLQTESAIKRRGITYIVFNHSCSVLNNWISRPCAISIVQFLSQSSLSEMWQWQIYFTCQIFFPYIRYISRQDIINILWRTEYFSGTRNLSRFPARTRDEEVML